MAKKYLLFTQESCTNCSDVKIALKEAGIEGEEVNCTPDEGFNKAREFKVMSTPTVILYDEEGKEVARVFTVEELKAKL